MSADMNLLLRVAAGNPGAIVACTELVKAQRGDLVERMDKAGIRGPAVWVLFSDESRKDLATFIGTLDVNTDDALRARLAVLGY